MDEVLLLLPALSRGLGRPWDISIEEAVGCDVSVEEILRQVEGHITPGQVQVLISLGAGPRSVGQIASSVGVSPSAATQMVDALAEHGMVERRHADSDRRVVLVDYVPQMRGVARRIVSFHKERLGRSMSGLSDEEMRAFLKGLKLLAESLGVATGKGV